MNWLTPLGFLALSGLAVLILIYLLKPNYQQKFVSSTFIWKLSLKYRKRKNPISRLRNLLILLCQILIITLCAFVIAQPVFANENESISNEKVFILDASASMRASINGETRFERAVNRMLDDIGKTVDESGNITVIVAGKQAEYLVYRMAGDNEAIVKVLIDLAKLADPASLGCTFGAGDVKGAMELAETVTAENPSASVFFYTGTKYLDHGNVNIVDVSLPGEYNVAILDVSAELQDGYYSFAVDLASYGEGTRVDVTCSIVGGNAYGLDVNGNPDGGTNYLMKKTGVQLPRDRETTLEINPAEWLSQPDLRFFSFYTLVVSVDVRDSFLEDNTFTVYGGLKRPLSIQYYSTSRNVFFGDILLGLQDAYRDMWTISITEVRKGTPAVEGFDLYIFEHKMPDVMPKDGIVLLVDPDKMPSGVSVTLGEIMTTTKDDLYMVKPGDEHKITEFIDMNDIGVSMYTRVEDWSRSDYTPLMFIGTDPVLLCRNTPESKIMIMSFSVNYSTFAAQIIKFSAFMYGVFEYYLPATTQGHVFDVNEPIELNARGSELTVTGPNQSSGAVVNEFPTFIDADTAGVYTLSQKLINGETVRENIFVRIPNSESNISKELTAIDGPSLNKATETVYKYDVIFWLLGAMVVLLFAEWVLHSRTGA